MDKVSIKKLASEDVGIVDSIRPDNWSDISVIHKFYIQNNACNCIKVVNKDNKIIGLGTGISYQNTGWLAHIIVSQEYRNQGIGYDIVMNRIAYLQNKENCKVITLTATDLGYPLYKKIGFLDESIYIMFGKTNECKTTNISKNIIHIEPKYYKEVLSIDKLTSGENREVLLKNVIKSGYIYLKNNHVLGFYLSGFGDGGVSAITEEAGIELLNMRILETNKIFIPEENQIAYNYLVNNGFKEEKKIHRMIIGERFERKPQYCYSRIGGFAG